MLKLLVQLESWVEFDGDCAQIRMPLAPAREGDAGMDLCNAGEPIFLAAGRSCEVPAGIRVKVPPGHCGLIRPRSSTFHRRGLMVVSGVIDEGYIGPLFTFVYNPGLNGSYGPVHIKQWERLAQLVIVPYLKIETEMVDALPSTGRGEAGFGSTGR